MLNHPIKSAIQQHKDSICKELDIIALRERNPIAHKWKVTYQSYCLRETVAWRFLDILEQSWFLHENGKALGARILLRSAVETIAILIYVNQLIEKVISESITFNEFQQKMLNLLAGSRNSLSAHQSINILTILQKCEKKYEGLLEIYEWLSESAHPNYEGMRFAYSETDKKKYITKFMIRTDELYAPMQEEGMKTIIAIFEHEYNEWESHFLKLEKWLVDNDEKLNQ